MPAADWQHLPLAEQYRARAAEAAEMIERYRGIAEPERIAKWERRMRSDLREAEKIEARSAAQPVAEPEEEAPCS
ncbi:MAG: hypothetical protein M1522_05100 [Actinobacteria bacterium]|jgi:hypothetical protein|nr:hypothetical protein [Actinomycetota bacterium]